MVNDLELTSELTSKWISFKNIQSNFTLISLITFGVLNQTSPNLQGSCRNTCRWCLRNYMINGVELTHELMSKWITFENTQANFTLISLITFEVLHQIRHIYRAVAVISADGACKITWKSVENWLRYQRELGKNNDKMAKRSVNTHCRQWVCGYCDCLGISFFFVWRLLTSESDVKNRETVKIGCFTSPSIRAISEKQSFLVHFQLGIIS